jgi:hypothetical protein
MAEEQGFLEGLLESIKSGGQSTLDAFQQDIGRLQEGRPPEQAIKAGGQVLGAMGQPAINPMIPALRYTRIFTPPGSETQQAVSQIVPGGDWFQMFTRQGGFGPFLEQLLKFSERQRFSP